MMESSKSYSQSQLPIEKKLEVLLEMWGLCEKVVVYTVRKWEGIVEDSS